MLVDMRHLWSIAVLDDCCDNGIPVARLVSRINAQRVMDLPGAKD